MREPQVLAGRAGATIKSMAGARVAILAAVLAVGFLGGGLLPAVAQAHTGPANPVASSYLARLRGSPPGLQARVLGGDLRLWLAVPASMTVIVLDYHGAPYLRFSGSGVQVNTNSWMYYLNQPIPTTPPAGLSPHLRPRWEQVGSGHQYSWHDGRLHALAAVALSPGQRFVGRWKIPLLENGRPVTVTGALWHADDPSIVWFWPIAVLLLCLSAVSRLRRRDLDRTLALALGLAALAAVAVLAVGHELYGEPFVTTGQEIVLGLILAFVAAMALQLILRGPGSFSLILISVGALWAAVDFIPVLLHGFVLLVVPAFLARVAAVVCLGCGIGLILQLFAFRLVDVPEESGGAPETASEPGLDDLDAWESLA